MVLMERILWKERRLLLGIWPTTKEHLPLISWPMKSPLRFLEITFPVGKNRQMGVGSSKSIFGIYTANPIYRSIFKVPFN